MSTELFGGGGKPAQTPESLDAGRWALILPVSSCGGGLLVRRQPQVSSSWQAAACSEGASPGSRRGLALVASCPHTQSNPHPPQEWPTPGQPWSRDIWPCFQLTEQGRGRVGSWMDSFCGPQRSRANSPPVGQWPAGVLLSVEAAPAQRSRAAPARTTPGSFPQAPEPSNAGRPCRRLPGCAPWKGRPAWGPQSRPRRGWACTRSWG